MSEDFDAYGVKCYYMNVAVAEPAGGGNVRVWNCIRRNGMLVPVCQIVIPAVELLIASRIITDAAMEIFQKERETRVH